MSQTLNTSGHKNAMPLTWAHLALTCPKMTGMHS